MRSLGHLINNLVWSPQMNEYDSISIFELRIHEIFLEILLLKYTYEYDVLALADTKNILNKGVQVETN